MRPRCFTTGALCAAVLAFAPAARAADSIECPLSPTPEGVAAELELHAQGAYDLPADRGVGILYVQLAWHVVRRADGSGALSEARITQAIADANWAFEPAGIQFCRAGETDYIDSDTYYDQITTLAGINALRRVNVVPNTINIYAVEAVSYEGGAIGGISSFTSSSVQGIVMRNSHIGVADNRSTVPHEIGHYFNLYHTHETAFGRECAHGGNCASAGDLLCDTPADPVLGTDNVSSACVYFGMLQDSCGGQYNPDTGNHMSYSVRTCRDHFSQQQYTKARATLVNLRPAHIVEVCPQICLGDATFDGVVDLVDFSAVLSNWGADFRPDTGTGDANGDGRVNFEDISAILAGWGTPCGPGGLRGDAPCCPATIPQ